MSLPSKSVMILSIILATFLAPGGIAFAASIFPDATNQWAKEEIDYLENLGLVSGLQDGTYGVGNPITWAQAAQLITGGQAVRAMHPLLIPTCQPNTGPTVPLAPSQRWV